MIFLATEYCIFIQMGLSGTPKEIAGLVAEFKWDTLARFVFPVCLKLVTRRRTRWLQLQETNAYIYSIYIWHIGQQTLRESRKRSAWEAWRQDKMYGVVCRFSLRDLGGVFFQPNLTLISEPQRILQLCTLDLFSLQVQGFWGYQQVTILKLQCTFGCEWGWLVNESVFNPNHGL